MKNNKFSSLQIKFSISFALVISIILLSTSIFSASSTNKAIRDIDKTIKLNKSLRAEIILKESLEELADYRELQYSAQQIARLYGWHVVLNNNEGLIVVDSNKIAVDSKGNYQTFLERFGNGKNFDTSYPIENQKKEIIGNLFIDTNPKKNQKPLSLMEYNPLVRNENGISNKISSNIKASDEYYDGIIDLVDPPLNNLKNSYQRSLIFSGIFAGLVGLLLIMYLTKKMILPIKNIRNAAVLVGDGNLSHRVPENSVDELGELSKVFNNMIKDLEQSKIVQKRLTADIAHELRTPLTNIIGYIEAYKDGIIRDEKETLNTIHEQTLHLSKLVDDLRILSIADSKELLLNKKTGNLFETVKNTHKDFYNKFKEKSITSVVKSEKKEIFLEFDETRIKQILSNLIENALIHTSKNGVIDISINTFDKKIEIQVSDNGTGIKKNDLEKIFDQFYRADISRDRSTGGTGLGLSIVKKLVEAHGGKIDVSSIENRGTSFIICLPL